MLYLDLFLLTIVLPVVAYQISTFYWKRSLLGWLTQLAVKYRFSPGHRDFFYKKLMAYDSRKGVLVYLDMEGREKGHVFGINEIADCELLVNEKNDSDTHTSNISAITLRLTLKTDDKTVLLPLYESGFIAGLAGKRIRANALRWYELVASLITTETEAALQTA